MSSEAPEDSQNNALAAKQKIHVMGAVKRGKLSDSDFRRVDAKSYWEHSQSENVAVAAVLMDYDTHDAVVSYDLDPTDPVHVNDWDLTDPAGGGHV